MIWDKEDTLLLADLHLGKVTHFRKNGIPLPTDLERDNYDRLATLILNYEVKKVLILGDLFHSDYNSQWPIFKNFLKKFDHILFELVLGNHDILHDSAYSAPNLKVFPSSLQRGPFHFTHEPDKLNTYNLAGHIHPGVRLKGGGRQSLKLPCFYFAKDRGILPAFGSFTGTHCIDIKREDQVYLVTNDKIIKAH